MLKKMCLFDENKHISAGPLGPQAARMVVAVTSLSSLPMLVVVACCYLLFQLAASCLVLVAWCWL